MFLDRIRIANDVSEIKSGAPLDLGDGDTPLTTRLTDPNPRFNFQTITLKAPRCFGPQTIEQNIQKIQLGRH